MRNDAHLNDYVSMGMTMGNEYEDLGGIVGHVQLACYDAQGNLRWEETKKNKITTAGDQYYIKMGCAGVGGNSAPSNLANGMKLGTATAAAAKSSTGSFIANGGYLSGSNVGFDSVVASAVTGTDTGWQITYVATWGPSVATSNSINEVAIVTDQATNNTSTGASVCISRAVLAATRDKQTGDTLIGTWHHAFLGA